MSVRPGGRLVSPLIALPFALLLFILPFPGTVALRLLCLATAFVLAVACWRRWGTPALSAKAAWMAWVPITGLAVAYSFDVDYSLGEFKNETAYTLMAYVAFFAFCRGRQQLAVLVGALGGAVSVIALWGLADSIRLGRWAETAGHGGAGTVGAFFVAVAPLLALALYEARTRVQRLVLAIVLVLLVIAAVATRQRILLPLFLIEAAIAGWLLQRIGMVRVAPRRAWLYGAVLVVLVAATLVGLQRWREQTREVHPLDRDVRVLTWPAIVGRILDHPLAGSGLGRQAMRKVHPDLLPKDDPSYWHAHNVFLNAGLSMGVPGVLALVFVFGVLVACYARLLRVPDRAAQLLGVAGIALVAGVVGRNMTNDFFVRDGSLLFWALNGAMLGAGSRLTRTAPAATA